MPIEDHLNAIKVGKSYKHLLSNFEEYEGIAKNVLESLLRSLDRILSAHDKNNSSEKKLEDIRIVIDHIKENSNDIDAIKAIYDDIFLEINNVGECLDKPYWLFHLIMLSAELNITNRCQYPKREEALTERLIPS